MKRIRRVLSLGLLAGLAACGLQATHESAAEPQTMNELATAYVKLVLALGQHDADYVDAYYGPEAWRDEAKQHAATLAQIEVEAQALLAQLDVGFAEDLVAQSKLRVLRREYLKTQLAALRTRAQMLQGRKLDFDEEARLLYDTEAPHYTEAEFEPLLKRIDKLLSKDSDNGEGSLAERYNCYLERYSVPKDRIEPVMQAAIAEARRRTLAHLSLPSGEAFELALVSSKPWSAYNWYQGDFKSRIELNTELPIPVSRVIDLAAHEGYPGHHVYNLLLERRLLREQGWPEFQVYALFSPQSLIAEGSADYGVGLAFPGTDKLAFTQDLFKRAGFDSAEAATYLEIVSTARELTPAGIEAARRYLDGTASAEQTMAWLKHYTLTSPERTKQRLAFFDKYRAYIINYSWGEELVRRHIEAVAGADATAQWQAFVELLSTPQTPAGLVRH